MIAKLKSNESSQYELWEEVTVKDINGNDVTIPNLVGIFSLTDLQNQKITLQNEIIKIDNVITIIQNSIIE